MPCAMRKTCKGGAWIPGKMQGSQVKAAARKLPKGSAKLDRPGVLLVAFT